MPDFRHLQSISQRNDLRWFRRTVSLRRWYLRLSIISIGLSLLLVMGWTVLGDHRVYWSAPVSTSHAMFQQDCKQCHVQAGAPLVRLATFNDSHHSVADADCQQCHAQQSHDHAPRMQKERVSGCVECHREHLGRDRLADIADQHCTQCHSDLQVTSGEHVFQTHVGSFEQHPQFLPWEKTFGDELWQQRDAMAALAVESKDGQWQDRTKLKFNHAKHLVDVGVLTVPPRAGEEAGHADRKQLACADCHQPDAAGEYMQPINYEQHCSACHKLEFSTKLAVGGALPHESPEVVYGLLRDRFLKYADMHPELFEKSEASDARLPNKRTEPAAKEKWQFVEENMQQVERGLFQNVQNGCVYCHESSSRERAGAGELSFTIVPPNIPQRWYTSSRFDHSRHREVSCVVCHDPDYEARSEKGHALLGGHSQLKTQLSSDILMPKIENCQACHGARPTNGQVVGARARCIDCHDYHAPHTQENGKLDDWARRKQ
jgi:hypothetical protein